MIIDRSGDLASAGVAQSLAPANASRTGLFIQNLNSARLWVCTTGAAASPAPPSICIEPGATMPWPQGGVPTTALSIWGASMGLAWTCQESQ